MGPALALSPSWLLSQHVSLHVATAPAAWPPVCYLLRTMSTCLWPGSLPWCWGLYLWNWKQTPNKMLLSLKSCFGYDVSSNNREVTKIWNSVCIPCCLQTHNTPDPVSCNRVAGMCPNTSLCQPIILCDFLCLHQRGSRCGAELRMGNSLSWPKVLI